MTCIIRNVPNERDQSHDRESDGNEVQRDDFALVQCQLMDGCPFHQPMKQPK